MSEPNRDGPVHVIKLPPGAGSAQARAWDAFIARLVELGIARPISPGLVTNDQLDRSVDTDKRGLSKLVALGKDQGGSR